MRSRLIHGYFTVNLDVVWNTVTDTLPSLLTAMKQLEERLTEAADD